ncbi:MAG: MATE family efflux transporter, partial [Clostridia bacterium]
MAKDLTQGSPMKLIVGFSVPLMFGFLFQQFYNFVDTAIVGKTLGLNALAAVGSTSSLNFLILGFCMGVCSGFSISVARCFGARDYKALRRYVTNGAWLAVGFSVVLTVLTVLFCRDMLRATKTPGDIFEDAYKYIVVILACIPVTIFYNFLSCVIRAMGDSRRPVIYLIVASVINIVLDFAFILLFHMGVTGAALATGISQLVAGLGCLHTIRKMDVLTFAKAEW